MGKPRRDWYNRSGCDNPAWLSIGREGQSGQRTVRHHHFGGRKPFLLLLLGCGRRQS
jgi:hypothetical protein